MNQKQQERLYDEMNLAKDIFARSVAVRMAQKSITEEELTYGSKGSLRAAKIFLDVKEKYIEELNKVK